MMSYAEGNGNGQPDSGTLEEEEGDRINREVSQFIGSVSRDEDETPEFHVIRVNRVSSAIKASVNV